MVKYLFRITEYMSREPDGWARGWLEKMRSEGRKGLAVEKKGNSHYVYWASTEWDKEAKKRRKLTEYIGILEPPGNLIISRDLDVGRMNPKAIEAAGIDAELYRERPEEVMDYRIKGAMMVLRKACESFYPALRECFPQTCDDLLVLAMARLAGRGRLCQAGSWFARQDNVMRLKPHADPDTLSASLKLAGGAIDAQDRFYEKLSTRGKKLAVDMTVCFSKGQAFFVKKGYNRFHLSCGQFNIAIICGLDDKLPQALRTVSGNIKESCITDVLEEMDIGNDCILVMDRGYFSADLMDLLHGSGFKFVIPVRRNSELYNAVKIVEPRGFRFRGNSVLYGIGEGFGYNAYRFENQSQRNSELAELMFEHDGDGDDRSPAFVDSGQYALDGDPSKAGNLILVTNLNEDPKTIYAMFKMRCSVEECNDSAKTVLKADSTYLRDNLSIMGFNFVTFLALRMYMTMELWIAEKEMTSRYTPLDLLDEYSSMVSITTESRVMSQQVPANVRRVEKDIGLGLFPIGG